MAQFRYPDYGMAASTETVLIGRLKNVLPAGRYHGFETSQTGNFQVAVTRGSDEKNILVTEDSVKIEETSSVVASFDLATNPSGQDRWDTIIAVHSYSENNDEAVYTVIRGVPGSGTPALPSKAVRLADIRVSGDGIEEINIASKVVLGLSSLRLDQVADVNSNVAEAITKAEDNGMAGDFLPAEANPFATKSYVDAAPTALAVSVVANKIIVQAGRIRKIQGSGLIEYEGTLDLVSDIGYVPGWDPLTGKYVIVYINNNGDVGIDDSGGSGYNSTEAAQGAVEALEYSNNHRALASVIVTTGSVAGTINSIAFDKDLRETMPTHRRRLRALDWTDYGVTGAGIERALGAASNPDTTNRFITLNEFMLSAAAVIGTGWRIDNASGSYVCENAWSSASVGYYGKSPVLAHPAIRMLCGDVPVEVDEGSADITAMTGWSSIGPGDWYLILLGSDATWIVKKCDSTTWNSAVLKNGVHQIPSGGEYYRPYAVSMRTFDADGGESANSTLPVYCQHGVAYVPVVISSETKKIDINCAEYWHEIDLSSQTMSADLGLLANKTISMFPFAFAGQSHGPLLHVLATIYPTGEADYGRYVFAGHMTASEQRWLGNISWTDHHLISSMETNRGFPIHGFDVVYVRDMGSLYGGHILIAQKINLMPNGAGKIFVGRTDDISGKTPGTWYASVSMNGFTFDITQPRLGWFPY